MAYLVNMSHTSRTKCANYFVIADEISNVDAHSVTYHYDRLLCRIEADHFLSGNRMC